MAKPLKILLSLLGGLLLLLVAALFALPLLFDPNDYRDRLAAEVKQQTGREFAVGSIRLAVFPWLRVELGELRLGNASGFGPEPMLTAQRAELGVRLLPLLRDKRVEASTLTLENAQLALAVDAQGRNNWQDLAKPADPAAAPEPPVAERLRQLDIGGIALKDFGLRYDNRQSGQQLALDEVQLKTGRLYQGRPFELETEFKARLTQPAREAAPASRSEGTVAFSGEVTLDPNGDVQLAKPKFKLDGQQSAASTLAAALQMQGDSLRYSADRQLLSTAPMTVTVDRFSLATPGKPPLSGKGQVVASLDYQLASGDALLGKLLLKMQADQAGAQPLTTAFELSSDSIRYVAATQRLGVQPLALRLENLVIGDKKQPLLTATGGIQTALDSSLAEQRHSLKQVVADLQLGGTALPGGTPRTVQLSTSLAADLAAQQATLAEVKLAAMGLKISGRQWQLRQLSSETPTLEGDVAIAPFELRTLLTTLGIAVPQTADASVLKTTSLNTQLTANARSATLKDLVLKLDDTTLRGDVAVRNFAQQAASFELTADRLDADRYLPPAPKPGSSVGASATPAAKADANATELPIDLVDQLNAQGTLTVSSMKLKNLKLANVRLKLDGARGATHRQQLAASLYGGSADLAVSMAPGAKQAVKLVLNGINAGPLLKDFIDSDKLSGKGSMTLDVTSTGRTLGAVKKALDGTLQFNLADGAVKGFNLGQIMRSGQALLAQQMPAAATTEATDFAELSGSGVITNGVLKSDQLSAKNPLLRLEGAGEVDLVKETINYLAKPTLVNTASGQGGKDLAKLSGISVPIRISGDLYKPKVSIDWKSAIQQQAVTELREKLGVSEEVVREKREELRSKAKEEIGKGLLKLFGSKPAAPAPAPAEPPAEQPAETPAP